MGGATAPPAPASPLPASPLAPLEPAEPPLPPLPPLPAAPEEPAPPPLPLAPLAPLEPLEPAEPPLPALAELPPLPFESSSSSPHAGTTKSSAKIEKPSIECFMSSLRDRPHAGCGGCREARTAGRREEARARTSSTTPGPSTPRVAVIGARQGTEHRSVQKVSWLPRHPPAVPSQALRPVDLTVVVGGYSGGGRAGFAPASLGSARTCEPWWLAPAA